MDFLWAVNRLMEGKRVRRKCWAAVPCHTQATPPIAFTRAWHLFVSSGWRGPSASPSLEGQIFQGWGGQVGAMLPDNDPIRDGAAYSPSDDDKTATDWELKVENAAYGQYGS